MEFSGSGQTPEQINKAGSKAMPGKLLGLSKSFSRTDHIPMDLTMSTPKTWISFGDPLLFLCLMAKSWNVLEEPGFFSSFLCCPSRGCRGPCLWRIPHPQQPRCSLIKVRTWARHSQLSSCSWEFLPVILDGLGQFTTLQISGIVIYRPPFASRSPP